MRQSIRIGTACLLASLIVGCAGHAKAPRETATKSASSSALAKSPPKESRPLASNPLYTDLLKAAAVKPVSPLPGEGWRPLFDGQTLKGWKQTDFAGHGDIRCDHGMIVAETGDPFTGLNYIGDVPRINYEVALEAIRLGGSDFFCGLTVPVKDSCCSLIVGGWGGSLLGISSLDGMDASENETTKFMNFEKGRWYRIRLRVTESRLEAWVDDEKLISADITDKKIKVRAGDIEMSQPFGIASWQTAAAWRDIQLRPVEGPDKSKAK